MRSPTFTQSKDGRERATVRIAVRVDKAMVQWVARTFNISESTALRRVGEQLKNAAAEWSDWHTPFVGEDGGLRWAHADDLHTLERDSFYSVVASAKAGAQ